MIGNLLLALGLSIGVGTTNLYAGLPTLTLTNLADYGYGNSQDDSGKVGLQYNYTYTDNSGVLADYVVVYRYYEGSTFLANTITRFSSINDVSFNFVNIYNYFSVNSNVTHCMISLETPPINGYSYYHFTFVNRILPFNVGVSSSTSDVYFNNYHLISLYQTNVNYNLDIYSGFIYPNYSYMSYLTQDAFWYYDNFDNSIGDTIWAWDWNKPMLYTSPYSYVHKFQNSTTLKFNYFTFSNLTNGGVTSSMEGYKTGYDTGYKTGYTEGQGNGYQNGYIDGQNAGMTISQTGFMSLFASLVDTPIRMLYSLFNFDLFGTSMLIIILSTLTAIVVIKILKKFI